MTDTFVGLLILVIGVILCFGGHRFFRFLMVLVGLAVGFVLGGTGVAAVTKGQFLDGLWGWVVAIVVALLLGGLAIPFYAAGVAVLGGVVAYLVASGVMVFLGYGTGLWTQAAGIVAGAIAIVLIYLFRVHRLLVIAVTASFARLSCDGHRTLRAALSASRGNPRPAQSARGLSLTPTR